MTNDVFVHLDTLRYTRDGFRTRAPIQLALGHNRVKLVHPDRVRAIRASYGGFPEGSSFPLPAVLSLLGHAHLAHDQAPLDPSKPARGVFQVFAHADASGDETTNKRLTDRRAAVGAAMLTGDVDPVVSVGQLEEWPTEYHQVMLRALGCDPGPIDGVVGPLTRAATEVFQQRYQGGAFDRGDDTPRIAALAVDGELDALGIEALIDAYVRTHSPRIDPARLHRHFPVNGCAAFNPVPRYEEPSAQRRLSIVVHDEEPPHPESTPCVPGDAQACPVTAPAHGCLWYREHVLDTRPACARHVHFAPQWTHLPNGRILLSVLTTVPDHHDVRVQVWLAAHPLDGDHVNLAHRDRALSTTLTTTPTLGVVQVVWEPGPGFEPGKDGRVVADDGSAHVPVFSVEHDGSDAGPGGLFHDSYPSHDLVVLFARHELGGAFDGQAETELELVHASGVRQTRRATDAEPFDAEHYAVRFEGMPEFGAYDLLLHHADGRDRRIFQGVEFGDLASIADDTTPTVSTGAQWAFGPGDLPDQDLVPPGPTPLGAAQSEDNDVASPEDPWLL